MINDFSVQLGATIKLNSLDTQIKNFFKDKTYTIKVVADTKALEKINLGSTTSTNGAVKGDTAATATKVANSISDLSTKITNLVTQNKLATNSAKEFNAELKQLQANFAKDGDINKFNRELNQLKNNLSEASTTYQEQRKLSQKEASDKAVLARQINSVTNQYNSLNQALSNAKTQGQITEEQFNSLSAETNQIFKTYQAGAGSVDKIFTTTENGFKGVRNQLSGLKAETAAHSQDIDKIVAKYTKWYLIAGMVNLAMGALKSIISTTISLDTAFTNISMVTGGTAEETKKLRQEYIELAQELGVTVDTITDAADDWLRAGLSIEDTNKAIRASTILAKVAQIESAEATEYLTSIMNGFNLEASELVSVVDKLSAVDIVAATSSAEIAEALSKSAKSAQLAGLGFDKYVAMIATVSETTRESADTIGNSFRSIFTRLQKVNIGSLEDGDSISDVDRVLKQYGIDLMSVTKNLEDMGSLLDLLGSKWQDFTTAQKSEIATTIAGNYQREKFLVLMEEYNRVLELEAVSTNSAGSATKKYQQYLDSLESSINSLKTAWVNLVSSLETSDMIRLFFTGAETVLNWVTAISEWIDSLGWFGKAIKILIPILIAGAVAIYAFKSAISPASVAIGLGALAVAVGGLAELSNSLTGEIEQQEDATSSATKAISSYEEAINSLIETLESGSIGLLTEKLNKISEESEILKEQKELQDKLYAVEKARLELAEARTKKIRVFRAGKGFVYESDVSEEEAALQSVRDAVEDLAEYKYEKALERAQEFVDKFNELVAGDKSKFIEGWEDLFNEFNDLLDTQFAEYIKKAQEFVEEFKKAITDLDDGGNEEPSGTTEETPAIINEVVPTGGGNNLLGKFIPGFDNNGQFSWGRLADELLNPIGALKKVGKIFGIGGYASGTSSAKGGLSLVGEEGPELRMLNQGDGIIPARQTANLLKMASGDSAGTTFNVSKVEIIEPNNFDGFVSQFCSKLKLPAGSTRVPTGSY